MRNAIRFAIFALIAFTEAVIVMAPVPFPLTWPLLTPPPTDVERLSTPEPTESDTVTVRVGRSSVDLPLAAELTLVGPVVELVERRAYVTSATIE